MKRLTSLAGLLLFSLLVMIPCYKAAATSSGGLIAVNGDSGGCGGFTSTWYRSGDYLILTGNYVDKPSYHTSFTQCPTAPQMTTMSATLYMGNNGYPPASGNYGLVLYVCSGLDCNPSLAYYTAPITKYAYLSSSLSLAAQNIPISSGVPPWRPNSDHQVSFCYALVSDKGETYQIPSGAGCNSGTPVPPTPPSASTCAINNGNNINVDLGTLDRAQLPTTPGGGTPKTVPISVVCSGDVAASVNMQLQYTPVTMGSTQAIPTSTTGVGVAVSYNDAVLTPSDSKPIDFIIGSNTVSLDFAAIRDPAVAVKDIAAGAFTASAVLVMTQQ